MDIGQLQVKIAFTRRPWWQWAWFVPKETWRHYRYLRRKEDALFALMGAVYLVVHRVEVVR